MKSILSATWMVVLVMACLLPAPALGQSVLSARLTTVPHIDGRLDLAEWPLFTTRVEGDHGFLSIGNDRTRLFLLIDVLSDRTADPRSGTSEGDWIEVFFDMDADGVVTPGVDRIYTLLPGSYDWRIQEYASIDGSRQPPNLQRTYSTVAAGFDCFSGDGTLVLYVPPLGPGCDEHRVWEVAIDLAEIGRDPSSWIPSLTDLRLGVLVHSENPDFSEEIPAGFLSDFSRMLTIELASVPAVIADASAEIQFDQEETDTNGDGVVSDPVEITQATQTRGNTLRLVADKDTAARVYVEVQEDKSPQPVTVSLYGTRDGHDLPGSPLTAEFWAQPHADFPLRVLINTELCGPLDDCPGSGVQFGRDNLNHTANFLLPQSWTEADRVTFDVRARFLHQEIVSRSVEKFFYRQTIPYYVIIPINEGTADAPVRPTDEALAAAESYIKTVYPVSDIEFERWEHPALNLAPTPFDGAMLRRLLDELIGVYDLLVALGADRLPDQIFGYTATSTHAQAAPVNPAHGLCIYPGCGHVAGGNTYGDTALGPERRGYSAMAHEIDHNIGDPDTWGEHVPGGSIELSAADPEWVRLWEESEAGVDPGYTAADIREFGFDTRLPWRNGYDLLDQEYVQRRFTVVPPYFQELLSYLQTYARPRGIGTQPVGVHPVQWTSPYRWERMFDVFAYESPTPFRNLAAAYISGVVGRDGGGQLNPVFVLPGNPWHMVNPAGTYALAIYYHDRKLPLEIRFTPSFVDSNGAQLDAAPFRLNVPVRSGITRVVLRRGQKVEQVLDEIVVSPHQPKVKITAPYGKTEWNGRQVIRWEAYDKDNDPLQYAVVYSPNGGKRWVPVAWGVQGTKYEVDMDLLPGGNAGQFKIVATDRFNTVSVASQGSLIARDKPPTAIILQPARSDASQFPSDDPLRSFARIAEPGWVTLEASGSDLEDGVLPDASFLWFYGEERSSLGRGKRIVAPLDVGVHRITLVVVDSAGNTAEKQLTLMAGQGPIDSKLDG